MPRRAHICSPRPGDDALYEPLASLLRRSVGVELQLREALNRPDVHAAAIYGSLGRRRSQARQRHRCARRWRRGPGIAAQARAADWQERWTQRGTLLF